MHLCWILTLVSCNNNTCGNNSNEGIVVMVTCDRAPLIPKNPVSLIKIKYLFQVLIHM